MKEEAVFSMQDLKRIIDAGHGRERPRRDHRTTLRRIWDAEHMTVLSTKVSKADAKRFRALCWDMGESPYSMLQAFVQECVKRR